MFDCHVIYLEVHNGLWYFDVDRFDNHNNVEWSQQALHNPVHRLHEIIPLDVQLEIVA